MRIANVFLSDQRGGAEEAHVAWGHLLQRAGHTVVHWAHPNTAYKDALAATGESVCTLTTMGLYDFLASWRFQRQLAAHQIDGVVAHNTRAHLLARRGRPSSRWLITVSHSDKARKLADADHWLVLTEAMKHKFIAQQRPAERITVFPNALMSPLQPPRTRPPRVIGYLGRFAPEKEAATLLTAFMALAQQHPDVSLRLAGAGPMEDELRSQAASSPVAARIFFDGWVSDKNAWLAQLDVLVVPSRYEPFGLVVLEGIAAGLPVLAARADGPTEILTQLGVTDWLFEIGSSIELTQKLTDLIAQQATLTEQLQTTQNRLDFYHVDGRAAQFNQVLSALD